MSEKHRFLTLLGLVFGPFWHHFSHLFRYRFLHRFSTSFWTRFKPKMPPKGTPKSTQNRSKNASEKSSKKRRWVAAHGVCDLVSKLVGRKAHFFESWMLFCCNWFVRFRKLLVFCCFTCAKMRAKNRIKINQKSVPNEPKITQNRPQICLKSVKNRPQIAPKSHSGAGVDFSWFLVTFWTPFLTNFRFIFDPKTTSKTCRK